MGAISCQTPSVRSPPLQMDIIQRRHVRLQLSRRSLEWWLSPVLEKGRSFREQPQVQITTDASLSGWGAHTGDHYAQETWSKEEAYQPINWLELRAVRLALLASRSWWRENVLMHSDNLSTKSYICMEGQIPGPHAGGHYSPVLGRKVSIGRARIVLRHQVSQAERSLHPQVFQQIVDC